MNIQAFFGQFVNANYFSGVDNTHPLDLRLGLDDKGRKAIELHALFKPRKVSGTSAIEVNQYQKDEYNTIRFSLADEDISGLFYKFCDDLIESTQNLSDKSHGYTAIVGRFFLWKKMFVAPKNTRLPESEIMGLIGEVLYMSGPLTDRLGGISEALKSWTGTELMHKDFSFGNTWTEVKTVNSAAQFVKISSLEQLASENEGELAVFSLEKMSSSYEGYTLNKLILDTRSMFRSFDEQDAFMSKIALRGYEYNNYYDEFVYTLKKFQIYKVDSSFPRLTASDVHPAICKASYELSLVAIKDFEITD